MPQPRPIVRFESKYVSGLERPSGAWGMFSPLPWFGPKTGFGWGWTPIAWEGWAITVLFVLVVALAFKFYGGTGRFYGALGASILGLVAICYLTGTAPG